MKLVAPSDRIVVTSTGHTYKFIKDEPIDVAYVAVKSCLLAGCYAAVGEEIPAEKKEEPQVQLLGPDRDEAIKEAMNKLVSRNGREDFTGTGKPDLKALAGLLNFQIDARERDTHWQEVLDTMAEE